MEYGLQGGPDASCRRAREGASRHGRGLAVLACCHDCRLKGFHVRAGYLADEHVPEAEVDVGDSGPVPHDGLVRDLGVRLSVLEPLVGVGPEGRGLGVSPEAAFQLCAKLA